MAMKFDYILASERVGRLEETDHPLIEDIVAVGIEKTVKCEHVRLRIERLRADQLAQDTERLRSTQTDDSYSAPTGRRSWSDNSVCFGARHE